MVIERGSIYWVHLGQPVGSCPGKRRPVLVISADTYNQSRLATVLAAVVTSNTALAAMPGNVFLPAAPTGLPRDAVVNVTALVHSTRRIFRRMPGRCHPACWRTLTEGSVKSWPCS